MSGPITPTSRDELMRILEIRNRGYLQEERKDRFSRIDYREPIPMKMLDVLAELTRVSEGEAEGDTGVRDFLGAAGLITRQGFKDEITDAGLAIIGRRAAAA